MLHRTRDLNAYEQHRLLRAIAPALPAVDAIDVSMALHGGALAFDQEEPLDIASETDIAALYEACAGACERRCDDEWVPATKAVPLAAMQAIVREVVAENFDAFFAVPRPVFRPTSSGGADFDPVGSRRDRTGKTVETGLPEGDAWFWRPVEAGMIGFMQAYDRTARIEHFAMANAVLDVRYENEARARKAAERARD